MGFRRGRLVLDVRRERFVLGVRRERLVLGVRRRRLVLGVRRKFFPEGVFKHWNRFLGDAVESSPQDVLKPQRDAVLRDILPHHTW